MVSFITKDSVAAYQALTYGKNGDLESFQKKIQEYNDKSTKLCRLILKIRERDNVLNKTPPSDIAKLKEFCDQNAKLERDVESYKIIGLEIHDLITKIKAYDDKTKENELGIQESEASLLSDDCLQDRVHLLEVPLESEEQEKQSRFEHEIGLVGEVLTMPPIRAAWYDASQLLERIDANCLAAKDLLKSQKKKVENFMQSYTQFGSPARIYDSDSDDEKMTGKPKTYVPKNKNFNDKIKDFTALNKRIQKQIDNFDKSASSAELLQKLKAKNQQLASELNMSYELIKTEIEELISNITEINELSINEGNQTIPDGRYDLISNEETEGITYEDEEPETLSSETLAQRNSRLDQVKKEASELLWDIGGIYKEGQDLLVKHSRLVEERMKILTSKGSEKIIPKKGNSKKDSLSSSVPLHKKIRSSFRNIFAHKDPHFP